MPSSALLGDLKGYSIRIAYSATDEYDAESIRREILEQLGAVRGFDYPRGIIEVSRVAEIKSPEQTA